MASPGEVLRIGELSKRAGVSPELLRAWERRYGLLRPARSAGGLRLYSPADVERVVADAAASRRGNGRRGGGRARRARPRRRGGCPNRTAPRGDARASSRETLDAFDEPRAQAILDRLLALATVETLLARSSSPTCRSSESVGSEARPRSPRSTSPRASCADGCSGLARGWGLGLRPAGRAGLPARRAARPRPDRLRASAPVARLANRLPRARLADRHRG